MSKQEKVVCAAFRFVFSCCEEIVLTLDYKMNYHAQDLYGREYLTGFEKGFITSKNRFVDPVEATEIAYNARQLSRTLREGTPLKPEDLY